MNTEYSKHNILSKITDSEDWFLVNLLSRQADILPAELAGEFRTGKIDDPSMFIEKGYLVDPDEERKRYNLAYLDFLKKRESDEIQIFFVPTYACNFACPYCYQDGYDQKPAPVSEEVIQAFFHYIDTEFTGRRKYITVFGGEPLLPGKKAHETIRHIISEANKRSLGLAFVTNGYLLEEYLPLLSKAKIRELQITLDGVGKIHDDRRPLASGAGTFGNIVKGIDLALAANMPVNLRMVVDRENLPHLPELARFAIEKKWTQQDHFKTQLGRNYELHYCQSENEKLYGRIELYQELYQMINQHPEVIEFHRPAFSVSRFLFDNGELPEPLFDSCPGCKTEWAFDYTGHIYSCTATVGKREESLGTFHPAVNIDRDTVDAWEERDVCSITACKSCELQLACGGGCAAVAKNKTGSISDPDCRPVKELLELGMSHYFDH